MQLEVKTVLNRRQHLVGFVCAEVRLRSLRGKLRIEATIQPHRGRRGKCSACRRPAPGCDRLPERLWLFVPLRGIKTFFLDAPRRGECATHGGVIEEIPWSEGRRPVTITRMCFLSRWARRRSWRETARAFHTGGECVYRSVEWFVHGGLAPRRPEGVKSIGIDELHWGRSQRADNFLTVLYQIDRHCRRLLRVGKRRAQATLRRGLTALGEELVRGLHFVGTDRWRPYLNGIAQRAGRVLHLLDRCHLTMHLNRAADPVRRAESGRLRAAAAVQAAPLKAMRWQLPRRGSRGRGQARGQLNARVASKLATARAWILKETFQPFWRYKSLTWAGCFLDDWTWRALRSRIEPMQKVARMRRHHQELPMNWFKAKGEISRGAVEGLNNKIRVGTRRSYGFRT
jgi:transposase